MVLTIDHSKYASPKEAEAPQRSVPAALRRESRISRLALGLSYPEVP